MSYYLAFTSAFEYITSITLECDFKFSDAILPCVFSSQDNRISLVDYVVSYYLHNVDVVMNVLSCSVCFFALHS